MAQATPEQQKQEAENTRMKTESREPIGKVIEIIGNSQESFEDAIRGAVQEASKTLNHITGVEVRKMTCKVRDNDIHEYRVDLKLAFGVEH